MFTVTVHRTLDFPIWLNKHFAIVVVVSVSNARLTRGWGTHLRGGREVNRRRLRQCLMRLTEFQYLNEESACCTVPCVQ
jgi:hypothetical protein